MKTSLIIHFDSEQTRAAFFEDIGELIFWNDNERDDDDKHNYKTNTSYVFPELETLSHSCSDSLCESLNYSTASIALHSTHQETSNSSN